MPSESTMTREDAMQLLSQLADGELDELSTRRVLAQIDDQPELREVWARWHAIRQGARGGRPQRVDLTIADGVRAVLEQGGSRAPQRSLQAVLARFRPFAVAATVACLGVLIGQQWPAPEESLSLAAGSAVPTVRSMPVMPIANSTTNQLLPASYGDRSSSTLPKQVAVEGLYHELARQRLEAYSATHAARGALHTPATFMTGALAADDNRDEQ